MSERAYLHALRRTRKVRLARVLVLEGFTAYAINDVLLGCTSFRGFCQQGIGVATSAAARSLSDAIVVLDARIYEASRVLEAFNNADLRQRVWRRSWVFRPDSFRLQTTCVSCLCLHIQRV